MTHCRGCVIRLFETGFFCYAGVSAEKGPEDVRNALMRSRSAFFCCVIQDLKLRIRKFEHIGRLCDTLKERKRKWVII